MSFSVKQPKKTVPSKEPPPSKHSLTTIYSAILDAYGPMMALPAIQKHPDWNSLKVYLIASKRERDDILTYKVTPEETRIMGAFLGLKASLPLDPALDAQGAVITPVPWGSALPSGIATVLNNGIAGVPPETPAQGFYFTDLATEEKWRQKLTWHGEAKELHQWVPKTIAWLKKARQWGAKGNLYVCVL